MTRAELVIRSALVGVHRTQRRLEAARTALATLDSDDRERLELEAALYGAGLVEKKLLALLGAKGKP